MTQVFTHCNPESQHDIPFQYRSRVPHTFLDHKLGFRYNPNTAPTTGFAEKFFRGNKILFDKTKIKNVNQSYIKYKL